MDSTFHVVFSHADRLAQSIADGEEVQLESTPCRAQARLDALGVAQGLPQPLTVADIRGARPVPHTARPPRPLPTRRPTPG